MGWGQIPPKLLSLPRRRFAARNRPKGSPYRILGRVSGASAKFIYQRWRIFTIFQQIMGNTCLNKDPASFPHRTHPQAAQGVLHADFTNKAGNRKEQPNKSVLMADDVFSWVPGGRPQTVADFAASEPQLMQPLIRT